MPRLSRPVPRRHPFRAARKLFSTLLGAGALSAAGADLSLAENASPPFVMPAKTSLPEVMLVPIQMDGLPLATGGWILIYRNGLRGPDSPDRESNARLVATSSTRDAAAGLVVWEITRTQNNICADHTEKPCPDMLRVLSVPNGFIAVPRTAVVDEDAVKRIFIVPQGMS